MRSFLSTTLLGLAFGLPASAADLDGIERSIAKEPAYQSKPAYCLLAFGSEARTRVWLVLDGNVLYVDRNANGDLTEPGERVDIWERLGFNAGFGTEWKAGTITEPTGATRHTDLIVRRMGFGPSTSYTVYVTVEGKRRQYAGIDEGWVLQFSNQPRNAPLIHFGGPLAMKLLPIPKQVLRRGDKPSDLTAVIGTPGRGKGTLAMLLYGGCVPDENHPVAEIEFPTEDRRKEPATVRVFLTSRC
jgi:hypothetical protein